MRFNIYFLAFICFCLTACGEKASQASVQATPAPNMKVNNPADKKQKKVTGNIQMVVSSAKAKKGEEVCLSLTTADFKGIMGYQHSIRFDAKTLKYISTTNYGLPHMGASSFGDTQAAEGSLNVLWYDMNVKGIDLPDNTKVFDICFTALGESGSQSKVSISDKPTKIEVVGPQKQRMSMISKSGIVTIQ